MEEVDDFGARGFDFGGLPEEGDGEVVVDVDGGVGIWSVAVVGNGLGCFGEVELGECEFL